MTNGITTPMLTVWDRRLWLARGTVSLRQMVAEAGLVLPARIIVTTGPTVRCQNGPALGQCQAAAGSSEGCAVITLWEELTEPVTVLAVLLHELIHVGDDCRSGHGSWFVGWFSRLGLVNPPSAQPSPLLQARLESLAAGLGQYPLSHYGYQMLEDGRLVA